MLAKEDTSIRCKKSSSYTSVSLCSAIDAVACLSDKNDLTFEWPGVSKTMKRMSVTKISYPSLEVPALKRCFRIGTFRVACKL